MKNFVQIPILGRIGPGIFLSSDFQLFVPLEYLSVDQDMISDQGEAAQLFALRIEGTSIINGVDRDGDIALLKYIKEVERGELVVISFLDTGESSLIYYYKETDHIRLQTVDPTMLPMIISNIDSIRIEGIVIDIIQQNNTD